jgi:hypothetical protein
VELADNIRKRGFKKWYERQLIESHAYLVTCFLCMILVAALLEELSFRAPGLKPFLMLAVIAGGGWSARLLAAVPGDHGRRRAPRRPLCLRAVPRLCEVRHRRVGRQPGDARERAESLAASEVPEVRTRLDDALIGSRREAAAGLAVLAVAFALDRLWPMWGQIAAGFGVWAFALVVLARASGLRRRMLFALLAWATAGELFCSLIWGIYTYRLGNIPHFVPPGHVLVFVIGLQLSRLVTPAAADRLTAAYAVPDRGRRGFSATSSACSFSPSICWSTA